MDPEIRQQALSHREWAPSRVDSYERLEFLGDAVLGVVVTTELFTRHPGHSEGDLTRMRQWVVSRETCAVVSDACGLADAMVNATPRARRAEAEAMAGGLNVRAALVESVIGAGWLSAGAEVTTQAVLESFADAMDRAPGRGRDPKSALQEQVQGTGDRVEYEITGQDGPPQDRTFHARVTLSGNAIGRGSGRSKQAAEQAAAAAALDSRRTGP